MPASRAVPGVKNRQGKPIGTGTSSNKRKADRLARFGPGSDQGGLQYSQAAAAEREEAAAEREEEKLDPRNRVGQWWTPEQWNQWEEDWRVWHQHRDSRNRVEEAKWWEKDHDDGEDSRRWSGDKPQEPASYSSGAGWAEPWTREWGSSWGKEWEPYSKQAEETEDELMEARPEPVVLREARRGRRHRATSTSSEASRSRTPPRLDPVPPEGIEIVGAKSSNSSEQPSKEEQQPKPLKKGNSSEQPSKEEQQPKPLKKGNKQQPKGSVGKAVQGKGKAVAAEGVLQAAKLCLDWHQVLQLGKENEIRPMWSASVRALKQAGWEVFIISFVTPTHNEARVQEMYRMLEAANIRDQVTGVWTCPERGGPNGKVALATSLGCSLILDDNPVILQEALEKGLKVFAITTKRERHQDLAKKPGVRVFRDLCVATEAILCQMIDCRVGLSEDPRMGKKGSFPTSKLQKVKAKAKCVAKAKAKAKATAKAKSFASRALKGALAKAKAKGPLKGVLKPTKHNLKKLGKEKSLAEKVQDLAKGADTAEEAVSKVQQGLSKLDKSKLWSQHNTHLNRNPEAKEKQDKLGKKDKGAAATLWFLRDKVPQFANFSENREEATTLRKVDRWLSEKEALSKWTEAELEAHCQSGRVQYRECPTTWGVWEYRDNHDFVKETSGRRSRNWSRGQEFHLEDDDEQEEGLEDFFALDVEKLLGLTEGKGKGKALALTKGGKAKGKGGRKGKGQQQEEGQLALQDGSTAEEKDDDVQAYLGKAKKARDLLSCTYNNLEEALAKAKASSYCSAASQKDAKKALADLDGLLQKTSGVLEESLQEGGGGEPPSAGGGHGEPGERPGEGTPGDGCQNTQQVLEAEVISSGTVASLETGCKTTASALETEHSTPLLSKQSRTAVALETEHNRPRQSFFSCHSFGL
ncbi:unnamed protein product [Symbiodinium sp. CCMP2592]|nr:unnamed protein product [Symbiodinium sp. CCMP2592]